MIIQDKLIVVRGGGDLATGVIFRLHRAGFPVVVLELEKPLVVRRKVALAAAVSAGRVEIEGMTAQRVDSVVEAVQLANALRHGSGTTGIIPVLVSPKMPEVSEREPGVRSRTAFPTPIHALIDARMAKRNIDTNMTQAPQVIALGPGFTAGEDCHAVIETMRGHSLGRVIWQGTAIPNTGSPGIVAGKGAERVLRAPVAGKVDWGLEIGDMVIKEQEMGDVAGHPVKAPFSGVVRGLIAAGTKVPAYCKIGDVDARANIEACFTISDKALAIGGGVLEAILTPSHLVTLSPCHPLTLSLPAAFNIRHTSELISIVGGGGKTALMFTLARALGPGTLTGTTTRIFRAQMSQSAAAVFAGDDEALDIALRRFGTALVIGEVVGEKAKGMGVEMPALLLTRPDVKHIILEADGSRMRPCKAPAAHEPVIPAETTLVVPVVGIDALAKQVSAAAHRPERVCALTGLAADGLITEKALADLITHEDGGLKGVPAAARVIPLINKVENAESLSAGQRIGQRILREERVEQVVLGAMQTGQPVREVMRRVTAVVLAAGQSKRMGQPKQLLPWGKTTVLGATLSHLAHSLIHNIVVVTGAEAAAVTAEIAKVNGVIQPKIVHNSAFVEEEMLSSLQAGLPALSPNIAAILVVLGDQPMVMPETYNQILVAYWGGYGELIAPQYAGKRGNPVLIGRRYFAELAALPMGAAPRDLLARYPEQLYLLPVSTESILQDLDTKADYERLMPAI